MNISFNGSDDREPNGEDWRDCADCYFPVDVLLDTTLALRSAWIALRASSGSTAGACVSEAAKLHGELLTASFQARSLRFEDGTNFNEDLAMKSFMRSI